jgi:hypothetical protein
MHTINETILILPKKYERRKNINDEKNCLARGKLPDDIILGNGILRPGS